MARVVVVGSANMDMVVRAPRIPRPGETVVGSQFVMVPGGKGANQAVAAARLGAHVTFVARVGNDLFGDHNLEGYQQEGIDCRFIVRDEESPSGVALIAVDAQGQNAIVVAPGANMRLTPEDVERAEEAIAKADVVLAQLEVPIPTVIRTAELARKHGKRMILNPAPAPAQPLPAELLRHVDILTPNESEAQSLCKAPDYSSPEAMGQALRALGVPVVIITLGGEGVLVQDESGMRRMPAYPVKAIDTTAAGDAFAGALAVALAEGKGVDQAVQFAQRVAGLSVTRLGAQPSLPYRAEVETFAG
ncbi:MAG: ribokinase [Chthonomonadetes bacterium]|jgi:ribokinase|nr:ribokinase [Chthonomonadetes bacterium]